MQGKSFWPNPGPSSKGCWKACARPSPAQTPPDGHQREFPGNQRRNWCGCTLRAKCRGRPTAASQVVVDREMMSKRCIGRLCSAGRIGDEEGVVAVLGLLLQPLLSGSGFQRSENGSNNSQKTGCPPCRHKGNNAPSRISFRSRWRHRDSYLPDFGQRCPVRKQSDSLIILSSKANHFS